MAESVTFQTLDTKKNFVFKKFKEIKLLIIVQKIFCFMRENSSLKKIFNFTRKYWTLQNMLNFSEKLSNFKNENIFSKKIILI